MWRDITHFLTPVQTPVFVFRSYVPVKLNYLHQLSYSSNRIQKKAWIMNNYQHKRKYNWWARILYTKGAQKIDTINLLFRMNSNTSYRLTSRHVQQLFLQISILKYDSIRPNVFGNVPGLSFKRTGSSVINQTVFPAVNERWKYEKSGR